MARSGEWTIGASRSCDVVINEETVSGKHCRLTADGERYFLEDLDSTNGTWVDGKRINGRTSVTPADRITLGNSVPFPWRAVGVQPTASAPNRWLDGIASGSPTAILLIAGGVLLAVVLGGALMSRPTPEAVGPQHGDPQPASGVATAASQPDAEGEGASSSTESATAPEPRDCLYWVVIEDPANQQQFRLGTASAIGERQLVTSATIVMAMANLRDGFSAAKLLPATGEPAIPVTASRVLPEYRTAFRQAGAARDESDRLRGELQMFDARETELTAADEQEVERLVEQLVETEEHRFQALENQVPVDLGLLEVSSPLPAHLPLTPDGESPATSAAVQAVGLPYPSDEPALFPGHDRHVVVLSGRVKRQQSPEKLAGDRWRYLVTSEENHAGQNWIGSPVLDSRGRVCAVYSRLTPPIDPREEPAGDRFDAAPTELLNHRRNGFVTP